MNVIQLRRSRVVKLSLAVVAGLGFVYLMVRNSGGSNVLDVDEPPLPVKLPLNPRGNRDYPDLAVAAGLVSHPGVKPTFKGSGNPGNFEPPATIKISGSNAPGENGMAYKVSPSLKQEEERLKNVYGFNQLVSDGISLNRTVPDMREEECQWWDYPTDLPKASVILVFHNEGWSTLFRTVNSIINRTPPQFLEEVVLVDDESELDHLHGKLDREINKPFYKGRVTLVRNKEREGLIRSRNNGALAARGEVVVFLDAHCEVGYNWLPPLLAPIYEDKRTLSVPVIDGIQWDDFSINPVYAKGSHSRGLFEWGMLYKEGDVPKKEQDRRSHHSEPYYAPTHAGGLFAISREWFKELGWYDPGLWVWGGENFELSFKVWMCGGNSVWVPCSRVSHVYRGHSCSSCHSGKLANKFGGQPTTLRNYRRVIETWFDDEYKEFFYTREPMARFVDMGDISPQLALKERLKCKSFDWFMNEVAYDVFYKYPKLPPNRYWGELINDAKNLCLDNFGAHPPTKVGASSCHHMGGNQMYRLNTKGQLTSGEWCTNTERGQGVHVQWCAHGATDGPWSYNEETKQMVHSTSGGCMALSPDTQQPLVSKCDKNNAYQKWTWKTITPYWAKS